MSKHIQLIIADPCHENWDHMSQAEKGRFCASCQKQVIDFTNMSDSQLAAFFKKPSDGSVCGRFFQDQLERDIEIPKKRIPWVKYFFQFALPAFLVSMKATAQGNVRVKQVSNSQSLPACSNLTTGVVAMAAPVERIRLTGDTTVMPAQKQNELSVLLQGKPKINIQPVFFSVIKGIVVGENNNPVPFATVMIKGTKLGVMANSEGAFKIEKPLTEREITLQVSSVGYEEKEMLINKDRDLTKELLIRLTPNVMDEVVVVGYQTIKGRILVGDVTSSTKKEKEKPKEVPPIISDEAERALSNTPIIKPSSEDLPMIKVYPNPVVAGTNINIGCQKLNEGYYYIQLSAQSGQQVLNKQTWIDGEVQVLNIDIPNVAAGVYFLKLTNKETNKRFTQKVVIE